MYSCTISGMSREIMVMDDRDIAEYRFWEKRDIKVIFGKFKSLNDKNSNSASSPTFQKLKKRDLKEEKMQWLAANGNGGFRVRRSSFSLRSRAIGPLDFDGARRENVLRGAGYAWTPDLRVLTNSKR